MKFSSFTIILGLLISCNYPNSNLPNGNTKVKKVDSITNSYPQIIDSLGLIELFDQAKWALYCLQCTDTALFRKLTTNKPIQFGFLDLRFTELMMKNDSIEFHFAYYKDSIECNAETIKNFYIADGVLFKNKQLTAFTTKTTLRYFWEKGETSRYEHLLQPEVVNFINKYNKSLNQWFYNEAVKRGVIK